MIYNSPHRIHPNTKHIPHHKVNKEYPLLIHPRMGELGYDAGCYIFTLNGKLQNSDNKSYNVKFLQSRFKFEKVGEGGFINSNLMFIHYAPNYKIELIELKK